MMDDPMENEVLFKKIVLPSMQQMRHANKLGITIQSWSPRRPITQDGYAMSRGPRGQLSPRSKTALSHYNTQYIQDIVVPIQVHQDEANINRSQSPMSFCSTSKVKRVPLPQVAEDKLPDPVSGKGMKTVATTADRYLSSVPSEVSFFNNGTGSGSGSGAGLGTSHKNLSGQALRLEAEQTSVARAKLLKRTSEFVTHRTDRMYYMRGRQLSPRNKYQLDESELAHLQAMQKLKQRANYCHSGRGFRQSTVRKNPVQQENEKQSSPNGVVPSEVASQDTDNEVKDHVSPDQLVSSSTEANLNHHQAGTFLTEEVEISVEVKQTQADPNHMSQDSPNAVQEGQSKSADSGVHEATKMELTREAEEQTSMQRHHHDDIKTVKERLPEQMNSEKDKDNIGEVDAAKDYTEESISDS